MYRHPTDFSFDNFNADIRTLFFDNRLAVSRPVNMFQALLTFAAISLFQNIWDRCKGV